MRCWRNLLAQRKTVAKSQELESDSGSPFKRTLSIDRSRETADDILLPRLRSAYIKSQSYCSMLLFDHWMLLLRASIWK